MVAEATPSEIQQTLAANLRRLRIARHLSLSELARATAMSKATLSSIENGRANPTVETLAGLAGALRVSLSELLDEPPLGIVTIVRQAQGRLEHRDGRQERLIDAGALAGGELVELTEVAIPARYTHEEPARAGGSRVIIYVLQGKLVAGPTERSTELGHGDYAAFPADAPVAYTTGRTPARALIASVGGAAP
jgi:XRE family transcriptional regulator, regulator of sulfur utilization